MKGVCEVCDKYDELQKMGDDWMCPDCIKDMRTCSSCGAVDFDDEMTQCEECKQWYCEECKENDAIKWAAPFDGWFCADGCYDELDWNDDFHKDAEFVYKSTRM